ncbi:hypothetical protein [Chryseobacterium salivictor]|uniref:Uncharacterized protein n=1 Tax=Chryseobacterium salivictor TaxID=2547600 RepID=A0A4P6ZD58_9FLAO|nr:hypothetical protein [Chryseobacterium salivictor]QBO57443.1 hypothetical protein NBC122_00607 [Chryseobacterium salivictor]
MDDEKTNGIRERFQSILTDNFDQLAKDLQELEPKDRIKFILEITRFVLPTLKSIESKESLTVEQPLFDITTLYRNKD